MRANVHLAAASGVADTAQKFWDWFSGPPLHILVIIAIAITGQRIGNRAITKTMNRLSSVDLVRGPGNIAARQKERARTTGTVLTSTLNAVIWVISLGMILGEFGLNLGPLIASAGVIGVALGLGAQTIVRDVLSGLFMLIEDQYGVGDKIEVLDISGTVERVGLRITTVRDVQGTLWYLRNGEILKVGNRSQSG
ncbi:MAG: mechanosensitive ion channel [Actinobacteria bacterium]|nr:mechanosensitive ion channel [Actinomycetota bacterium]MSW47658.1 mechanosensitive ion channel [Actinomycetota bacterium]MSX25349.1 mechanosensitive ion channel [Actinomycetota bacterium]MSY46033.1 mechanosensitive ion channel [Actinomycetota bacterium]MSY57614.1 mechanosensitive ion channel [Actinomycetota bacterium]